MPPAYFQVVSDLHLETHPSYTEYDFPVTATALALLGDIGRIADKGLFAFLEEQLHRYATVYYLMGNHEPYHMTWKRARTTMREFAAKAARRHAKGLAGEFVFLDQTRHDFSSDVTVLGCTLFSQVTPQQEFEVETRLVDFKDISRWTVDDHNAAHEADLAWLNREVQAIAEKQPHRRVVIFTHHSPCNDDRAVRPIHRGSKVGSGFITDLGAEPCWTNRNVVAWAFGHTHYSAQFTDESGKQVLANQKGYYMFPQQDFKPDMVLKIAGSEGEGSKGRESGPA